MVTKVSKEQAKNYGQIMYDHDDYGKKYCERLMPYRIDLFC